MTFSGKSLVLLALIMAFCFTDCAFSRKMQQEAAENAEILKHGVLLVRLNSADMQIDALEKSGKSKRSEAVHQDNQVHRERTMQAFREHFDFTSNIYFFEAADARYIKDKKFDQVAFLNLDGNVVKDAAVLKDGFLIAAFDRAYDVQLDRDENNEKYYKLDTYSTPALVVFDENFIQLNKPFPYKSITTESQFSEQNAVQKLNQRLYEFY